MSSAWLAFVALGLIAVLLGTAVLRLGVASRYLRSRWFGLRYGRALRPGDAIALQSAIREGDVGRLEELADRLPNGRARRILLRQVFRHYRRRRRAAAWALLFSLPEPERDALMRPQTLRRQLGRDIKAAVRSGDLEAARHYASLLGRSLTKQELRLLLRASLRRADEGTAETVRGLLNRAS